jgi:hypothetical protein
MEGGRMIPRNDLETQLDREIEAYLEQRWKEWTEGEHTSIITKYATSEEVVWIRDLWTKQYLHALVVDYRMLAILKERS